MFKNSKTNIKVWTIVLLAIFSITGTMIFSPAQAISPGSSYPEDNNAQESELIPIVSKPQANQPQKNDSSKADTTTEEPSSVSGQVSYDLSSTKMGIYTGPGDVNGHDIFESWLGKTIPYTTDYIDYKGGWSKDFRDSDLWLHKPWGKWVSQGGRRLVLGVPMLEKSNAGQFDRGINGDFDTYFRDLATQLVANNLGNSIIRLGYEANCDTIGPWQAVDNPKGYKLLFRHQAAVMKSVAGASFLFDWTVCNGLQYGHTLNSFSSFYPGNDAVDIVGIDIYDVKWQDTSVTPQKRWSYTLARQMGVNGLIAFARAHGKPLSFPEWGLYGPGDSFAGGGDNPYFIEQMAKLISSTKPLYQAYFDLDWGGGVMADFKRGQAAYKQIFGH